MSFNAHIRVTFNRFDEIAGKFEPIVQDGLVLAANNTLRRSRPLTPVRTGHLRNSAQIEISRLVVVVFWMAAYAAYQEFGTRRGIRAKLFATNSAELEMKALVQYMSALEALL